MADIQISSEKFYPRLQRLLDNWTNNKTSWGDSDSICIMLGTRDEDSAYSKASSVHLYLLGYEITDSIIIITKNSFTFMASDKKCKYLENSLSNKSTTIAFQTLHKTKDEGMNRENFNKLLGIVRKGGRSKLGSLYQVELNGPFIQSWLNCLNQSQLEKVEISQSLGLLLCIKDEIEMDCCRRAAVLSNKVLKHGFVAEMESLIDEDKKIKHDEFASKVEAIILEPSKIGLNVSSDAVDACYTPIIQSGGNYDIKISAQSNDSTLTPDVIICSLGAKYKGYCANVARTFMVNVPTKVENHYSILLALFDACLEQMVPGRELKEVYVAAKTFLSKKDPQLLAYLPKSLGFVTGLEFRDSIFVLNDKNTLKFEENMVFNLSVGLHNIPLSEEDKNGCLPNLKVFSLLLADTVRIQKDSIPEVLTKMTKEYGDVSYSISDEQDDEKVVEEFDSMAQNEGRVRRSARAKDTAIIEEAAQQRASKQQELMKKKINEARKRLKSGNSGENDAEESLAKAAIDLRVYRSPVEYPRDVNSMQIRVDMEKEAIFLPINGRSVPFHISTIKSITRPEEDKASWMRINFFIPGASTKEAQKNMQQLVLKYGYKQAFIKEFTFRSSHPRNLTQAYQMFQELRKRVKQREQKAEQEKDLVVQAKLIRIKDQRVPRLQDLTMRPQLSGRKCVGTIEAHQNGLRHIINQNRYCYFLTIRIPNRQAVLIFCYRRFTSTKGESLDIMYQNIKHAIYQPCEKTTMVLVHFHLKDYIMIGKKKHKDVQFFTEVIDSSLNLEGARRSSYDPDELDEEQREKEMRKRLNIAFKEFCLKVEKVATHYGFTLQIDIPFRKSGFEGNCHKEMVFLQPTTHCLVNLTEQPPFVLTLADIDHVHFERVTYATRNFDAVFIFKNHSIMPRTITAIEMKYFETIQDWLSLVEITYTMGTRTMNWTDTMAAVRDSGEFFYLDEDEDGEKKAAGWLFLSGEETDDEEGEDPDDADESFDSAQIDDDSEESDDSDDDESDYEDEEESDDEYADDDEEGMDWDDLERDAIASDKVKRGQEEEIENLRAKKVQKRH